MLVSCLLGAVPGTELGAGRAYWIALVIAAFTEPLGNLNLESRATSNETSVVALPVDSLPIDTLATGLHRTQIASGFDGRMSEGH